MDALDPVNSRLARFLPKGRHFLDLTSFREDAMHPNRARIVVVSALMAAAPFFAVGISRAEDRGPWSDGLGPGRRALRS